MPNRTTSSTPIPATKISSDTSSKSSPVESPQIYRIPICNLTTSDSELFSQSRKVFLRPKDVEEIYSIPLNTTRDLIAHASETHFPFFKIGRSVFIPHLLLRKWIIENCSLVPIDPPSDKSFQKKPTAVGYLTESVKED